MVRGDSNHLNAAVRWTAACRRLDGGNTLIFFPKGRKCSESPAGHRVAADCTRIAAAFQIKVRKAEPAPTLRRQPVQPGCLHRKLRRTVRYRAERPALGSGPGRYGSGPCPAAPHSTGMWDSDGFEPGLFLIKKPAHPYGVRCLLTYHQSIGAEASGCSPNTKLKPSEAGSIWEGGAAA